MESDSIAFLEGQSDSYFAIAQRFTSLLPSSSWRYWDAPKSGEKWFTAIPTVFGKSFFEGLNSRNQIADALGLDFKQSDYRLLAFPVGCVYLLMAWPQTVVHAPIIPYLPCSSKRLVRQIFSLAELSQVIRPELRWMLL